ncbi:hypothetical protein HK104_008541 [Borealophlyctis nickersoniae]|nr:hypothetical protein HK104_008541 [Borealophlyctis nickersoniae]
MAPPTNKKPRMASSKKDTTPKEEKNPPKDNKIQKCAACIRNGESGPFDHRGKGTGDGEGSGGVKVWHKTSTVVMGQRCFLRAAQLADTIENAVKEVSQLVVEGNAVLLRFVLHRLEADLGVMDRRNEYAALSRPDDLPWADGRGKAYFITAAVKQYVTNAQVYTIYQITPRLRKLLIVEIFDRVPSPISGKRKKKLKAKVISVAIRCLQGIVDWDPIVCRGFLEEWMDPCYASFLLHAIKYVLDDISENVLKGQGLFITEKDAQTGPHPTLVEAKLQFEKWIPVHHAISLRYEEYARNPSPRKDHLPLKPFRILPKYSFTPKCIIINTDVALHNLWSLADWPEVEHPPSIAAFKEHSQEWWRRTFSVEKVETVDTGKRRFRGAVYTDGVSCRILVAKKVSVACEEARGDVGEGDEGGGEEVAVADALEDSDEETGGCAPDGSVGIRKRKRTVAAKPPTPGLDPYFRPVDIPDGMAVWAIDPGRRDPGETYRVSLGHYYQLCGFTAARKKRERWLKQSPTVQEALNRTSDHTYKTSALATFDAYLEALLPNLSLILDFYFRRRHRRLCFDAYIRTQTAWHEITQPFANSVVALGAAIFAHNSRGHPTGPLKKLRQKLKDRAFALRLIGEFNTSRVCHLCDGFFDQENQRWWALRVCRNVCGGRIMNRDFNAAKNILEIFLYMNTHAGQRPEPFFFGWDNLPPRPGVH